MKIFQGFTQWGFFVPWSNDIQQLSQLLNNLNFILSLYKGWFETSFFYFNSPTSAQIFKDSIHTTIFSFQSVLRDPHLGQSVPEIFQQQNDGIFWYH